MPSSTVTKKEQEILDLIQHALLKGYTVIEVQAPMGDMLTIASGNNVISFKGYSFRIGQNVAIICK